MSNQEFTYQYSQEDLQNAIKIKGYLSKKGNNAFGSLNKRFFRVLMLSGDYFLVYRDKETDTKIKSKINFNDMKAISIKNEDRDKSLGFFIECHKRTFDLTTSTQNEAVEWVESLSIILYFQQLKKNPQLAKKNQPQLPPSTSSNNMSSSNLTTSNITTTSSNITSSNISQQPQAAVQQSHIEEQVPPAKEITLQSQNSSNTTEVSSTNEVQISQNNNNNSSNNNNQYERQLSEQRQRIIELEAEISDLSQMQRRASMQQQITEKALNDKLKSVKQTDKVNELEQEILELNGKVAQKQVEINQNLYEIDHMEEIIKENEQEKLKLKQNIENLETQLKDSQSIVRNIQSNQSSDNTSLQHLHDQLNTKNEKINEKNDIILSKDKKISDLNDQISSMQQDISDSKLSLEKQKNAHLKELKEYDDKIINLMEQISYQRDSYSQQISDLKSEENEHCNSQESVHKKALELKDKIIENLKNRENDEIIELQQKIDKLQEENTKFIETLKEKEEIIQSLEEQETELIKNIRIHRKTINLSSQQESKKSKLIEEIQKCKLEDKQRYDQEMKYKQEEIERLEQNIQDQKKQYQNLVQLAEQKREQEKEMHEQALSVLKEESFKQLQMSLSNVGSKEEKDFILLKSEIKDLTSQLTQKQDQIQELKREIQQNQDQIEEKSNEIAKYENQARQGEQKYKILEDRYQIQQNILEKDKGNLDIQYKMEDQQQIQEMSQMVDDLQLEKKEMNKKISLLQQTNLNLENQVKELQHDYENNSVGNTSLNMSYVSEAESQTLKSLNKILLDKESELEAKMDQIALTRSTLDEKDKKLTYYKEILHSPVKFSAQITTKREKRLRQQVEAQKQTIYGLRDSIQELELKIESLPYLQNTILNLERRLKEDRDEQLYNENVILMSEVSKLRQELSEFKKDSYLNIPNGTVILEHDSEGEEIENLNENGDN